jgi:uncharacterized membrane protein
MDDDGNDESAIEDGDSNIIGASLVSLAVIAIAIISLLVFFHFQYGVDIPFLQVKNPGSASYWGQIGDFVGGVLNPVLSFIALLAVVLSLRSQASELKAARAEARAAQKTQTQQTKIFKDQSRLIERQSFESVFFGLLDLHSKNSESVTYSSGSTELTGAQAFAAYARKHNVDLMVIDEGATDNHESDVLSRAESFYNRTNDQLGRYFRTLFELIFYVDNYGVSQRRSPFELKLVVFEQFTTQDESFKKTYAGIVAATFSSSETECIMLYCLSPKGKGLKLLCEKYGLLKHVPDRKYQKLAKALFKPSAFV